MSILYCIVFSAFREEITRKNYSVVFCPKGILKFQVEIKNYKTEMLKMTENKKNNNAGTVTAAARSAYEGKVGLEAFARAGRNPNLKGVVHEVLVKDAHNLNPANILSGKVASLTKSTTAVRDDVIVQQAGKVVSRMQLKDTAGSIGKTLKQAASGKYAGTNLIGTKETAEAFNRAAKAAGVTQKMTSSGVSSTDTARIATQTIGSSAGKLTASSVSKVAGSSGAVGAAISAGIEVFSSGAKFIDGEIDGEEFVCNVAREGVGGGLAAASASAVATVASTAAATALATVSAPVWIPVAVGVGAAVAVGSVVKGIWDSIFD